MTSNNYRIILNTYVLPDLLEEAKVVGHVYWCIDDMLVSANVNIIVM